jgi:hypothetical protein
MNRRIDYMASVDIRRVKGYYYVFTCIFTSIGKKGVFGGQV